MRGEGEGRNGGGMSTIVRVVLVLIELWLVAMALILGLAFIMGLLGANPEASFAAWIYDRAESIMVPFEGIFEPIEVTEGTEVRLSLLFAMLVYGVLAALIGGVARRFA